MQELDINLYFDFSKVEELINSTMLNDFDKNFLLNEINYKFKLIRILSSDNYTFFAISALLPFKNNEKLSEECIVIPFKGNILNKSKDFISDQISNIFLFLANAICYRAYFKKDVIYNIDEKRINEIQIISF